MGLLYSNYESQNNTTNNLKINAVSGTLTKTYLKSYFISKEDSQYTLFTNEPFRKVKIKEDQPKKYDLREYWNDGRGNYGHFYYFIVPIVILQIMLCGENKQIYEVIDKNDFDELNGISVEKVEDDKEE